MPLLNQNEGGEIRQRWRSSCSFIIFIMPDWGGKYFPFRRPAGASLKYCEVPTYSGRVTDEKIQPAVRRKNTLKPAEGSFSFLFSTAAAQKVL